MLYKHNKKNLFLEIMLDETLLMSPREWSNLGYFITVENNHFSPDENKTLYDIIDNTQYEVNNAQEHMEAIIKAYEIETDEKVKAIYPINSYEHGNLVYSLGERHGFDHSNCGFYIITDKTQKEMGTKKQDFEKVINQELKVYNKWANGEVYQARLYKEKTCKCCHQVIEKINIDNIAGLYSEAEAFKALSLKQKDFKLINDNL